MSMRPSIPLPIDHNKKPGKYAKAGKKAGGRAGNIDAVQEGGDVQNDDADDIMDDESDEPLLPLSREFCNAPHGLSHFVHESCLREMKATESKCPRCQHFINASKYELPGASKTQRYCKHINGGFSESSKIRSVVDWYNNDVSKSDKVSVRCLMCMKSSSGRFILYPSFLLHRLSLCRFSRAAWIY